MAGSVFRQLFNKVVCAYGFPEYSLGCFSFICDNGLLTWYVINGISSWFFKVFLQDAFFDLFLYNLITVLQLPQSNKSSCGDLQFPCCQFFIARERHVIFLPRKTCYVFIFSSLRLLRYICIKSFILLLLQTQHI